MKNMLYLKSLKNGKEQWQLIAIFLKIVLVIR